jgi:hypothetical protein
MGFTVLHQLVVRRYFQIDPIAAESLKILLM